MRIFDRYVVREFILPFLLSLLLLTFLMLIQPVLDKARPLIAEGIDPLMVGKAVLLLVPFALTLSIPMAVLLGLLIALGRLSADREFVAMQACGISIYRLLRPLAVITLITTAGTAYTTIVVRPVANQAFREVVFKEVAAHIENQIQPRVLLTNFANHVLYVRDVDANRVMHDVFFAETTPGSTTVTLAREGHLIIDREHQVVQLQLSRATQHVMPTDKPDDFQAMEIAQTSLTLDPTTVFKKQMPARGLQEMSLAELYQTVAATKPTDDRWISARYLIHYDYAIPFACAVLAVVALGLGVTNRKDGTLASFAIGVVVIFAYYTLDYFCRAAASGRVLSPAIAPWIPPVVIGIGGVALLRWRARATDRPMLLNWSLSRIARRGADDGGTGMAAGTPPLSRMLPRSFELRVPGVRILDLYTARQYIQVFVLTVLSALGIFYISTFIDLAEKLFRGSARTMMLLTYFYYQAPLFLYYIIPIAVLVATLVTMGVMTKNSEMVVMKACGISLYRTAAPLLLFAVGAGVAVFVLQEIVLERTQWKADRLERIIRDYPSGEPSVVNRWIASDSGEIYYYWIFDPAVDQFKRFWKYRPDLRTWRLSEVTYADTVGAPLPGADAQLRDWTAQRGWVRTLATARSGEEVKTVVTYAPFDAQTLMLEPPAYFKTREPDPTKMSYRQLGAYIGRLRASGGNLIKATVQRQGKISFPFVTLIMTLLAVPFAVTTGRRGAMYGIGIGIALSIAYWGILQVSLALGENGVLTPTLAAWSANLIFGAAALYGILTVRT